MSLWAHGRSRSALGPAPPSAARGDAGWVHDRNVADADKDLVDLHRVDLLD